MKYIIGICDDESNVREDMSEYIERFFSLGEDKVDIYTWDKAEVMLEDISKGVNLDVLFLDIELPYMDGVAAGHHIRKVIKNKVVQIIYISYKTSYAIRLFNIHPYDFLIKPLTYDMVSEAVSNVLQISSQDRRFYLYKINKIPYKVLVGDILYFESERKHIKLHMTEDKVIEFVGILKNEINNLPEYFIMIGQSYIINSRHIKQFNPEYVIMDNNKELPVSRSYKEEVCLKLLNQSRNS